MSQEVYSAESSADSDILVSVENVTKRYDDVIALDDVSLTIRDGEFFTLLGPSGAGKSTLLHMIGGFVIPSDGTITIGGVDVTDAPPQERPTSTVFQEYALFPHLNVEQNVRYGLSIKGVDDDRAEQLITDYLEMLQIEELRHRRTSQLSGGQRQRVALARSLVVEPDILLLDEPLGPLDEKLRREMQLELKNIQERLNTTFIYVTHDQEEALTMSDRMGVLNYGELIEVGSPDRIYNAPKRGFTAEFIGEGNLLDGTIHTTDGTYAQLQIGLEDEPVVGRTYVDDFGDGDEASMIIRPNQLQVESDPESAQPNVTSGTLIESVFKGEVNEYIFDVGNGEVLKLAINDSLSLEEGESAHLSWSKDDAVVVLSN